MRMVKLTSLLEIDYNEHLIYLLGDKGKVPQIGNESGNFNPNGISLFKTSSGSYRYVMSKDSRIISALQIMSSDGKNGIVANVYTAKDARNKGYAKELFLYAKKKFKTIEHSNDLSDSGKLFVKSTAKK